MYFLLRLGVQVTETEVEVVVRVPDDTLESCSKVKRLEIENVVIFDTNYM